MNFKERFSQKNTPFWILTISLVIGLILPMLIREGMFMDGVLYSSVSNNLAQGYGSMWFMKFSELGFAGNATFHEQPPLVFWIQALFFKVFGNGIYVERLYSFLTALITTGLIYRIWKLIYREQPKLSQLSWLPVFMWIIIPVTFWSYQNNVHENTMGIFVLFSFYFGFKVIHYNEKFYFNLIISGIFIFLASFSKGVPGLFTLGIPFLYWVVYRRIPFYKMVLYSLVLLLVPLFIYGVLLLIPTAKESLSIYFFERLLGRTSHAPTVEHRTWILVRLFHELIPIIVLSLLVWGIAKWKQKFVKLEKWNIQHFLFLFLTGLSGSLPLMLTMVQKAFYFSAALPFFGLAFAGLIAPTLSEITLKIQVGKKGYKLFRIVSIAIFFLVMIFSFAQIGKVSRNKEIIHDLHVLGEVIGNHTTIRVDERMWNEWDLQTYMMRYYNISWDKRSIYDHHYYLLNKSLQIEPDSNYEKVKLSMVKYDLYRLK